MERYAHGGVVGYGSLLNPDTIRETVGTPLADVVPVTCAGYRRAFDTEAAWRETSGDERAVLNARPDPDARLNGVLLPFGSRSDRARYRSRERGYDLRTVDPGALAPYRASDRPAIDAVGPIEIPVGGRGADDIRPIPSYLRECLAGARYWGDRYDIPFREEFVTTTALADGTPLSAYLGEE